MFHQRRSCAICDGPGSGCFFRVYSCRPCASFFRRSVRDRRQYVCRLQGNCPINKEGMRNSCRACRLKRCYEAGMRPDLATNSHPLADSAPDEASSVQIVSSTSAPTPNFSLSPSSSSPSNSTSQIATFSFDLAVPLSQQLAKSLKEFEEGSRAVVAQYFGLNVAIGASIRLINNSEAMQLEKACAPLYIAFMRAHFPEFDNFDNSSKANLMKKFMVSFCTLSGFDWTLRAFPNEKDLTQFVLYPGCVADHKNHCEDYFSTVTGVGKQHQINLSIPLFDRYINFMNNVYKPLGVSSLENAALTGIMLWNAVNQFSANKFAHKRDALFGELHSLAIKNALSQPNSPQNPSLAIPTRFGQLLNLIMEITSMDKDLDELFSLSKVFLDANSSMDFTSVWDEIFGLKAAKED